MFVFSELKKKQKSRLRGRTWGWEKGLGSG